MLFSICRDCSEFVEEGASLKPTTEMCDCCWETEFPVNRSFQIEVTGEWVNGDFQIHSVNDIQLVNS